MNESHCAKCPRCQAYKKMADDEALRHATRASALAEALQWIVDRAKRAPEGMSASMRKHAEEALATPTYRLEYSKHGWPAQCFDVVTHRNTGCVHEHCSYTRDERGKRDK